MAAALSMHDQLMGVIGDIIAKMVAFMMTAADVLARFLVWFFLLWSMFG